MTKGFFWGGFLHDLAKRRRKHYCVIGFWSRRHDIKYYVTISYSITVELH